VGITVFSPADGGRAKKMHAMNASTNGTPEKAGALMNIYVNGTRTGKIGVEACDTPKQYIIAEGLGDGDTLIEVTKVSEPAWGMVVVKGINLPDGATLKDAPPAKRVIEFLGDSDTTAIGSMGPPTLNMFVALKNMMAWSDTDRSWAAHVARSFGVDHINTAAGGIGLMLTGDKYGPLQKAGPSPEHYEDRLCFNWGLGSKGDRYSVGDMPEVDLVVIWLGQNDLIAGVGPGNIAKGTKAYRAQLEVIRRHRPTTPVLCLYPLGLIHTSHSSNRLLKGKVKRQAALATDIKEWAEAAAAELGGEKAGLYVRGVAMEPAFDPEQDFGLMYEIGHKAQLKWARGVVPHVKAIMGWDVVEGC
jgi:hypothetical protein